MSCICSDKSIASILRHVNYQFYITYCNDRVRLGTVMCICMNGLLFRTITPYGLDCKDLMISIYECNDPRSKIININSDVIYRKCDPRSIYTYVIKYIGVKFKNMTNDQILKLIHLISILQTNEVCM